MSDIKSRTADLKHLRSLLFAPGSDERKLRKALEAGADLVVADLEDGVAPERKGEARELVARVRPHAVRVNGVDTPWFQDDLALLRGLQLDAVMLPKASPESVAALGDEGPPVIAIVETAQGLRLAFETASRPRVAALMLGTADLGAELGLEPREDELEILYARSKVVVDSAAAGVGPPIDVVHLDFRDLAGLERSARFARSLGFGAKACIHLDQVPVVNSVFASDADEVEWARRVVEAFERGKREGRGAVALEGTMVDLPVVERARRILERRSA